MHIGTRACHVRPLRLTADTGAGMAEVTHVKVFKAFFRRKPSAEPVLVSGSARKMVNRHQGTLKIRSSQSPSHPGTVFILFLPPKTTVRWPASTFNLKAKHLSQAFNEVLDGCTVRSLGSGRSQTLQDRAWNDRGQAGVRPCGSTDACSFSSGSWMRAP